MADRKTHVARPRCMAASATHRPACAAPTSNSFFSAFHFAPLHSDPRPFSLTAVPSVQAHFASAPLLNCKRTTV